MSLNERRTKILNMVREDGHVKVQKLVEIFKVSDVTIRQDLEELENLGYVQREYGGAFLKGVDTFAKNDMLCNQTHMEEKKLIASRAVKYVSEGDVIILDSGSTTTELAKLLLNFKSLTVITNALNIAMMLGANPGIQLIVTGGEFKAPTLSLTGEMAGAALKNIHVQSCFLATAGISDDMYLTYPSLSDLVVKTAMVRSANKVYLLADSSKSGNSSFAALGKVSLVDYLISDDNITEKEIGALKAYNVEVIG